MTHPLVDRVSSVLLRPQLAWPVIATEPGTTGALVTSYAVPLVVFSAICHGIGALIGGPIYALAALLLDALSAAAAIAVLGAAVYYVAPSFGAVKQPFASAKVAIYAFTPAAVGAIFAIVPFFGGILAGLVALYAIYQLYLGLLSTLNVPQANAIPCTAVVCAIAFVVAFCSYFATAGVLIAIKLAETAATSAAG